MYELIKNQDKTFDIYLNGAITKDLSLVVVNDIKMAVSAGFNRLTMHINSFGGSIPAAWDIVSTLRSIKDLTVVTINEGFALSAGAVLLAAGDERIAFDFSTAMVHDPMKNGETLEALEGTDKVFMEKVKDGILKIYNKSFNISKAKISKLLTKETYFNAEEQLEIGLVQQIIEKIDKPAYDNSLPVADICNIITEFNKQNINNKTIKMDEVTNYLGLEEGSEENILNSIKEKDAKAVEIANELKEANDKLKIAEDKLVEIENTAKLDAFLIENKLEEKKESIQATVEKYGIEVLNSLIIGSVSEKVETEEEKVKNEVIDIVNQTNDELNEVKETTVKKDDMALANELFSIDGDEDKANALKISDPAKHQALMNLYYDIVE